MPSLHGHSDRATQPTAVGVLTQMVQVVSPMELARILEVLNDDRSSRSKIGQAIPSGHRRLIDGGDRRIQRLVERFVALIPGQALGERPAEAGRHAAVAGKPVVCILA